MNDSDIWPYDHPASGQGPIITFSESWDERRKAAARALDESRLKKWNDSPLASEIRVKQEAPPAPPAPPAPQAPAEARCENCKGSLVKRDRQPWEPRAEYETCLCRFRAAQKVVGQRQPWEPRR